MRHLTAPEMKGVALDVEVELGQLTRLTAEVEKVNLLIAELPDLADLLYENQGLKLHNFYTGCERIFRIVASELNGALPDGYDRHKRLLARMAVAPEGRPAVISSKTARSLEKYLSFRHIVRNIYGYELEAERIAQLVAQQAAVWQEFDSEVRTFVAWLRDTADQLG